MRRLSPWPLAVALAALPLLPALSQDGEPGEGGTGLREPAAPAKPEGWKGLPGAKDPGEPNAANGWTEQALQAAPFDKDLPYRTPRGAEKVGPTNMGAWIDVTGGKLPLTGVKGGPIRFQIMTSKIMIDADGDGTCESAVTGGMACVTALRADGTQGPYWFKLRRDDRTYLFARATVHTGKIDDTPVALLDEDCSGQLGEIGKDAVRIGASPVAQPWSEVLNVKGKLFYVKVDQAGTKLWHKPFDGPTGRIDLASRYAGKSKPLFVTIRQGDIVLDAAAKETLVPAGTWTVEDGLVGPGPSQCARIRSGRMEPIVVDAGTVKTLPWGMAGVIDFSATKDGQTIRISMSSVRIYGQAGEEYQDFRPKKFTPNVQVVEEKSRREIYGGNVGAGC